WASAPRSPRSSARRRSTSSGPHRCGWRWPTSPASPSPIPRRTPPSPTAAASWPPPGPWRAATEGAGGKPRQPSTRPSRRRRPGPARLAGAERRPPGRRRRRGGSLSEPPEGAVGGVSLDLEQAYRVMTLARQVDERMWKLARAGRAHFAVPCSGQEAIGAGYGLALRAGFDFVAPHYRDLAAMLALGM